MSVSPKNMVILNQPPQRSDTVLLRMQVFEDNGVNNGDEKVEDMSFTLNTTGLLAAEPIVNHTWNY